MLLIRNATLVNEGLIRPNIDILVDSNGRIEKVASERLECGQAKVIDATGLYVMPGVIDTHVHFREPGLTAKADIHTESSAAVAGGTTSIMDMPNTTPQALTQELLQQKYDIAATKCLTNYSFYMGLSNTNMDEVLKTNMREVCALKVFMCHSTGNMKVDEGLLGDLFSQFKGLICTHCEDEPTVIANSDVHRVVYGDNVPWDCHADIRSEEACVKSTELAIRLAKKHNARLHVVHLTAEKEIEMFSNDVPLEQKRITCEVAPHHLWFDRSDYATFGSKIKCNPAIKEARHKQALLTGLLDGRIDMIATDHAPHLSSEKEDNYWNAPSGIPMIQHSLNMLLQFHKQNKITLEQIAENMCHNPAIVFQVEKRGFVREGYWADLVLFDLNSVTTVSADNLFYKCKWSPFEGYTFDSKITHTIVNGQIAYDNGQVNSAVRGQRILFDRV